MRPAPPALRVTLVSGLHAPDRLQVCRQLAGASSARTPDAEVSDETEDSGDFALVLADELLAAAHAGATGSTIVGLEPDIDVMEVGFVLETELEDRRADGPAVELHDLVAVVSARDVHRWLRSPAPAPTTDHVTAEYLASQVEFATIIVLTDRDAVQHEQLRSVLGLLRRLNPDGPVMTGVSAGSNPVRSAGGRWCARRLGQRMGWTRALVDPDVTVGPGQDVSALVFRDPRPFHPARLFDAIRHSLVPGRVGRIARSRGLVQVASRSGQYASWRSAGDTVSFDPTGMSSWDTDAPLGQEIVFFGEHLDRDQILGSLEACLLTDDELIAGPSSWVGYDDPFPAWPDQRDD